MSSWKQMKSNKASQMWMVVSRRSEKRPEELRMAKDVLHMSSDLPQKLKSCKTRHFLSKAVLYNLCSSVHICADCLLQGYSVHLLRQCRLSYRSFRRHQTVNTA